MSAAIPIRKQIERAAGERILILDGAMGSMIQAYRKADGEPLLEDDFRGLTGKVQGERFRNHPVSLKGCNDLLCITMPDIIYGIHEAYLKAGADIIETCSFNSNAVSLADYNLTALAYELSAASARLARTAADAFSSPDRKRFVAGSMGPTSKSASIPIDMNDLAKRAIYWDELEAAYYDNARGLLDGGADLLIIETIFDTLNAKAAIFAVRRLAMERGIDVPLIISATVSNGGRLLSGQSIPAFCVSVQHANPLALGLNCSFGADKLKNHVAAISEAASFGFTPCLVCAYPNAGLPNPQGIYDESPESMANHIEEYMREGLVNIIGGCCGSTPAHIAAIAGKAEKYGPRFVPEPIHKTFLAGNEILEISRNRLLSYILDQANVAINSEFLDLIVEGDYDGAVDMACEMARGETALIDVCMQDDVLDEKNAMITFLRFALQYPELGSHPVMLNSVNWDVLEAGLKCLQGKGLVNSISLKDGDEELINKAHLVRAYGAAVVIMLADEEGPAFSLKQRIAIADRSWKLLVDSGFPPEDIILDPDIFSQAAFPITETSKIKHDQVQVTKNILPLMEAQKNKIKFHWHSSHGKKQNFILAGLFESGNNQVFKLRDNLDSTEKIITLNEYPLERVIPHIDWESFIKTWDLAVHTYPSAYFHASREEEIKNFDLVLDDAKKLLENISKANTLHLRGVVGFFKAYSDGDDVVLPEEDVRFCFLRNQERKIDGSANPCLADYFLPRKLYKANSDHAELAGLFALSAGFGLREAEREFRSRKDDYNVLLLAGLANALAEAFSEEVHRRLSSDLVKAGSDVYGIRPVFGYPACPDHKDKEIAFGVLGVRQRCGLDLTDKAMLIPAASVCGMYIAHPDASYFGVGMIGDDQLSDWASRKDISLEEARKRLGGF